ncbi:MAG: hypothetical protein PHC44_08705 [Lutispora sp.]|nr:hypothetical protein [Lutispora sp.]MDD4834797.1 hypothetical protein [Lutispora sp.]
MLVPFFRVLVFSILTVYTLKFIKRKFASRYFSLCQIIQPESSDLTLPALIITFLPAFIYSYIISILTESGGYEEIIMYSLMTPLLLIWPSILYPGELLPPEVYKKRKMLIYLYFALFLTYIFISVAANNLYLLISNQSLTTRFNFPKFLEFYNSLNILYQNLIANGIWTILTAVCIYIYKRISKKLSNIKPIDQGGVQ